MQPTVFKQVKNNAKTFVDANALNNTTSPLSFDVDEGDVFSQPGAPFWATVWDVSRYADPGDDPNMRIGLVTARTDDQLTATWGQLGTPIQPLTGKPRIAQLLQDNHLSAIHAAINELETKRLANIFVVLSHSGVADYLADGTSDNVELQSAMNAAAGGVLYIRGGSAYNIAAVVNVPSNIKIVADPGVQFNLASGTAIKISGKTNVHIRDLTVDGNSQAINNYGILIENSTIVSVKDCRLQNMTGFGVFVSATASNTCENVIIADNYIQGKGNNDVVGGGPANSTNSIVRNVDVQHNRIIQDCTTNSYENAFDIVRVNRVSFTDNNVTGKIQFGTEQFPNIDSKFNGNTVEPATGKTTTAVLITTFASATSPNDGIPIVGNTIRAGAIKITGISGQKTKHLTITGNVIKSTAAANGIELTHCSGGTITGNTISGAASGVLYTSCDNFIATGNIFDSCTNGLNDATGVNTLRYGSNIFTSVTNPIVGHPVFVPATASDTGYPGQTAWDSSFFYICTAANTWKRVAISSW